MTVEICSYWEGCPNPSTHGYGGYDYCDEHDVRTPEEATIDRLRSDLALARDLGYAAAIEDVTTAQRERDEAHALWEKLAADYKEACEDVERLRALLSRTRDTLEPLGAVAGDESTDGYRLEIWGRDARPAREVAAEIAKELGDAT